MTKLRRHVCIYELKAEHMNAYSGWMPGQLLQKSLMCHDKAQPLRNKAILKKKKTKVFLVRKWSFSSSQPPL